MSLLTGILFAVYVYKLIKPVFLTATEAKSLKRMNMKFSKTTKMFWTMVLSVFMSHVPNVAFAEGVAAANPQMISTSLVLADVTRAQAEQEVKDFLKTEEIQKAFVKQGLSADEASMRLASLSDQELRQLSLQVQEARAGGDILVAILIVVLIIFLVKRI